MTAIARALSLAALMFTLVLVAAACGDDTDGSASTDATAEGNGSGTGDTDDESATGDTNDESAADDTDEESAAGDTDEESGDDDTDDESGDDGTGEDGDDGDDAGEPADPVGDDSTLERPEVEVPDSPAPDELVIEDLVEGSGDALEVGSLAIVHYLGVSYSTGEVFDASWDRGQPFPVTLGQGAVIQGWEQGLLGMRPGGRRQLTIPPDLAYGEAGQGSIAPNETLIFVVDLVAGIPASDPADEPEAPEVPEPLPTELAVEDLIDGDGAEAVSGSTAYAHYVGVVASTGEVFDSSWGTSPLPVTIGTGIPVPGVDDGLAGMAVGGRRQVVVPPDQAFGEAGVPGVIEPDETLIFIFDLVAVVPG